MSRRIPHIPEGVALPVLRDACDRAARPTGYRVKALPTVSRDRKSALVTFVAPDGLAFPGNLPAGLVLPELNKKPEAG